MADFTYSPNVVHSATPIPNIEITSGQTYNQSFYKLSDNFLRRFELRFGDVNLTKRNLLRSHFEGQYGPHKAFNWTSIPDYVKRSTQDLIVNYDKDSEGMGYYEETPAVGGNVFTVTLYFVAVDTTGF